MAKLDGTGQLQWNTFLGGAGDDEGEDIAVDASGNVYVDRQRRDLGQAGAGLLRGS